MATRLESVTREYNRCIRFNTSAGPITVKVLGDEAEAAQLRDRLIDAFTSPSIRGIKVESTLSAATARNGRTPAARKGGRK